MSSRRRCGRSPRRGSVPPRAFTDEAVAGWELEHLFQGGWTCLGHTGALDGRGAFFTRELGGESVLAVAGEDGAPRAFFNVCRHRGARLLEEPEGRVRRLQCPYHAWSYGFDGVLRTPPRGLDPACFSLPRGAPRRCCTGSCSRTSRGRRRRWPGTSARWRSGWRATGSAMLRRAAAIRYDVAANWKAIVQNYSECLHCPGVHPELNRLTHYLSGVDHEGPGAWCGGAMTLNEGVATMGRGGGWPAIAGVDERAVLYYALLPNALISLHPDYAMLHTLWPRGAGRTEIVCEWFFEPETIALDGLRPRRRGRLLGHRQPPGLARLRAHAEGRRLARVLARALHRQRAHGAPVRPDGLRAVPQRRLTVIFLVTVRRLPAGSVTVAVSFSWTCRPRASRARTAFGSTRATVREARDGTLSDLARSATRRWPMRLAGPERRPLTGKPFALATRSQRAARADAARRGGQRDQRARAKAGSGGAGPGVAASAPGRRAASRRSPPPRSRSGRRRR